MAHRPPPAQWAIGVVAAISLGLCALVLSQHGAQRDLLEVKSSSRKAALERALHALESRLSSVKGGQLAETDDILMHAAPESGGAEKPLHPAPGINRLPGHAWTAEDQESYDNEMKRAVGDTEKDFEEQHLPSPLTPISDPKMQDQYAHNVVRMLKELNVGYLDELLQWAESGSSTENNYIAPLVEGIEAPMIKQLDAEAHQKVKETVHDIALRKDLSAAEMKKMRARLLVPLLLRIRARVHQQVELYTVTMLRKVILGYAKEADGGKEANEFVAPAAGEAEKPSADDQMEYTLRDIDALYAKGVISEPDYEAQKAKVLSEWLGSAIKDIGGKEQARKALTNFLWPPIMTRDGCHCLLPFKYKVPELEDDTIEYHECTDIGSPGEAWCAVDPDDEECGHKSDEHEGKHLGWERWDYCVTQPPAYKAPRAIPKDLEVQTERGCTCKLPFEFYPENMGGRRKVTLYGCTTIGGEEAHWCATEGACGHSGNPETGEATHGLSWTHWDRCVGEPAGYLIPEEPKAKTVQDCECRDSWKFIPKDVGHEVTYSGCIDADTPGTAWCAVDGLECGTASEDPHAGIGAGKYGWTKWDICAKQYQPIELQEDLEKGLLPHPLPYVRTESGCSCKLPWKIKTAETGHKLSTEFHCQRYDANYAWCPVNEKSCGHKSWMYSSKSLHKWGWTRWDKCVGDPPGFLVPEKEKIMTEKGCQCKVPWKYEPADLDKVAVTYVGCTDIESPNKGWCAVDAEASPGCGTKSEDKKAVLGKGADTYGWDHWDYCMEAVETHAEGAMPKEVAEVHTVSGCTCKFPYDLTPVDVGETMTLTHCNRYKLGGGTVEDQWCVVEEEGCGHKKTLPDGEVIYWDDCIGEPPGFLEATPTMTEQDCECLLPFEFAPPELKNAGKPHVFTYTSCTDIGNDSNEAWCAVRGFCGTLSTEADAHMGPGGWGWTHWDKCKAQPEQRSLLPDGQPELPEEVPRVRTQHGCNCKLPYEYAPARNCAVDALEEGPCVAQGGDMQGGWCVTCTSETFTECNREDEDDGAGWCAVEGECGVLSQDYKAALPASAGGYGWTHWDRCIGQPAGFLDPRVAQEKAAAGEQTQLAHRTHGSAQVKVESVTRKHEHAQQQQQQHASVSTGRRGRGLGREESDIKNLEKEMSTSIKALNHKIQQLDEEKSGAARAGGVSMLLLLAVSALLALWWTP